MNKTVSQLAVKGFSLRLKTTTTDILYGVITTDIWNPGEANLIATFTVPDSVLNKLIVGTFYKVQLAYIDSDNVIGYYSTLGIIKYTAKPRTEISGFTNTSTNINIQEYIGIYHSKDDPTEKAYQYKFTLFNGSDEILETSGWQLHNSYEDTELDESMDAYTVQYAFEENVTYKIQYSVITNNNLEVSSPRYLVMQANSIDPELKASLVAKLDYDNACINLALVGKKGPNGEEYAATGAFLLSRASSADNFSTWLAVSQFRLTGDLPSNFLFKDYTIEQGATYRYCLQQFNDAGIYSNRILAPDIIAEFEDIFLYDGERQLKVRFNPKVTSFKTVLLESKKNTIGNKYPFIFRNGAVAYKEFPISGLISYMMDNDEFFIDRESWGYEKWQDTTDIIDENITFERRFKLEVLNWLNDGKVKLFKSPQEGNYLVRLMNVSLSPIDTVSRMIHNFQCTASEVAAFTTENLSVYNLLKLGDIAERQMRWATILLQDLIAEHGLETVLTMDLLNGYGTYHLKFTDMIQGTMFSFTNASGATQKIMIGVTGQYEIMLDEPIYNLKLLSSDNRNLAGGASRYYTGSITYGIMSTAQNRFDTVNKVRIRDITLHQVFGPHNNLLDDIVDLKHSISRMYFARFSKLTVQPIYDENFGVNGNTMKAIPLSTDKYYAVTYLNDSGDLQNNYYRYSIPGTLTAMPHYETIDRPVELLSEYCYYTEKVNNVTSYYLFRNEQLIPYTGGVASIGDNKYTTLNQYTVYDKQIRQEDGSIKHSYYKYNGSYTEPIKDYSTQINYGGVILDVGQTEEISFGELTDVPEVISIGSGVCAELSLQVKILTYSVEDNCAAERSLYEATRQDYAMYVLGLKQIANNSLVDGGTYFIWQDDVFVRLEDDQIEEYKTRTANVYTICNSNEIYTQSAINTKYNLYITARNLYMTALAAAIAEKEKELPV